MKSTYGSATVGDREHQEDDFTFVLADERRADSTVLVVLCDGMGGHVGGEVASTTAVRAFQAQFEGDASTDPQQRLGSALEAANRALGEKIRTNPQYEGMGSTLIGAIKLASRLVWISVGDSHIYLFRNGKLAKLNADHSLFSELLVRVRKGEITLDEARANPRRNALMSAVMGRDIPLVDYNQVSLKEGDLLIFASDGLDTLPTEKIEQVVAGVYGATPDEVTEALLDAVKACRKPKQDNTTVVACYHTARAYPFWRESTRWAMVTPGTLTRGRGLTPIMIGAVAATVVALGLLLYGLSGLFLGPDDAAKGNPDLQAAPGPASSEPKDNGEASPVEGEVDGKKGKKNGGSIGSVTQQPDDPAPKDGPAADTTDADKADADKADAADAAEGTSQGQGEEPSPKDGQAERDAPADEEATPGGETQGQSLTDPGVAPPEPSPGADAQSDNEQQGETGVDKEAIERAVRESQPEGQN